MLSSDWRMLLKFSSIISSSSTIRMLFFSNLTIFSQGYLDRDGGAFTYLGFDCDVSVVGVHDPLADG